MKAILFRLRCLLGCALIAASLAQAHATSYTIIDLGSIGGNATFARDINASGQVTGMAFIAGNSTYHAFLYSDGTITDLGTLGGSTSFGSSINDSGQVAGWAHNTSGKSRAVVYRDGVKYDLGTLDGAGESYGRDINDSGQVTGYARIAATNVVHAFLYSNGAMTDLGSLIGPYGYSYGNAINASGNVVGESYVNSGGYHAFLYSNGTMIDLGTLGGFVSSAYGINASGQIVGFSRIAGNAFAHAFLYSGGAMIDLGTLGRDSSAQSINASGQIVGSSYTVANEQRAFLYSNNTMADLNDFLPAGSGWVLFSANSINDAGQIAGYGYYNGQRRAFIMSPAGGVTLSATTLSLIEGGASGTYMMQLTDAPKNNVAVNILPGQQLSVSPTQLIFTAADWNTPQTVTVQAIQDGIAEGKHTGIISHTSTSADARYNDLVIGKMTVSIAEAVIPTVSVSVPFGTFWIQPDLPVTGTAAAGATVTLTVNNLSTGETRAVSAVAGADGNWGLTLTGLTDGSYELQPEAGGLIGSKVTVAVDSRAPVSTLSVTSNNGPTASGWYTGAVNIAVATTDGVGGSGVERSESMLDDGAWTALPAAGLTVSADGNHTLCYRSVDKAGNPETSRCVPMPVDATAPLANPVFDSASNLLHLNAQDAVSGIASIEISRDGGQTWSAQSGPFGFTRDGTYTVQYRVRDIAGNLASGQTTVNVVTIPNVTAPSDQTASEAASQSFNLGSFSDQAADNPWNIDVDWGDGSAHSLFALNAPGTLGALPHAYLDNGTYTVTIKVTDQAGNTGAGSFGISVGNVAPTATFSASSGPLNEGDVATLAFSNSIDPSPIDTQAGFSYAFDCGSGYGAAGAASSVTCAALDNPSLIVKGRVIDKDGGATEYSAVVSINNVAPILGVVTGPTSPVQRDTPAAITVDFTDPGVRDTHTAMIDWDDGAVSDGTVTEANGSGSVSASHSYVKPGRYIVTVIVTDKDGASATTTYTAIQVRGGPPNR